ncbi:MAG: hypothetical protein WBI07_01565 [Mobilitalea sp.]
MKKWLLTAGIIIFMVSIGVAFYMNSNKDEYTESQMYNESYEHHIVENENVSSDDSKIEDKSKDTKIQVLEGDKTEEEAYIIAAQLAEKYFVNGYSGYKTMSIEYFAGDEDRLSLWGGSIYTETNYDYTIKFNAKTGKIETWKRYPKGFFGEERISQKEAVLTQESDREYSEAEIEEAAISYMKNIFGEKLTYEVKTKMELNSYPIGGGIGDLDEKYTQFWIQNSGEENQIYIEIMNRDLSVQRVVFGNIG